MLPPMLLCAHSGSTLSCHYALYWAVIHYMKNEQVCCPLGPPLFAWLQHPRKWWCTGPLELIIICFRITVLLIAFSSPSSLITLLWTHHIASWDTISRAPLLYCRLGLSCHHTVYRPSTLHIAPHCSISRPSTLCRRKYIFFLVGVSSSFLPDHVPPLLQMGYMTPRWNEPLIFRVAYHARKTRTRTIRTSETFGWLAVQGAIYTTCIDIPWHILH